MKAIVYHKYGSPDVLKLEVVPKPTPVNNELLIKVPAVSVNLSDWEGLVGKPLYARMRGLFNQATAYRDLTSRGSLNQLAKTSGNSSLRMRFWAHNELRGRLCRVCLYI